MSETANRLEFQGRVVELDGRGYLRRANDWDRSLAHHLAAADGIELGPLHWRVIDILRDHHRAHGEPPRMRALVAALAAESGDAGSRTLYRLFPEGPIRQACRYAGLPRPARCI